MSFNILAVTQTRWGSLILLLFIASAVAVSRVPPSFSDYVISLETPDPWDGPAPPRASITEMLIKIDLRNWDNRFA